MPAGTSVTVTASGAVTANVHAAARRGPGKVTAWMAAVP